MNRTIKLVITNNINKDILLQTLKVSSEVYNIHANYGFENKCVNKHKLHKELYRFVREKYQELPSALVQTMRDNAIESLLSLKSNKRLKTTPKKNKYSSIRYDKRTCNINLIKQQASLSWIGEGRLKVSFNIPEYYRKYLSWNIRGIQLVYKRNIDKFFLHVTVEKPNPELQKGPILGIDKGITNFLYCSDGDLVKGEKLWKRRGYEQQRRRELQSKGTRGAKRKLRTIASREKRFINDYVHCIVNQIILKPFAAYAIEDLTNIRDRSTRSKAFNSKLSNWVYRKFDNILSYKAETLGKRIIKVDPRYTSQECSACHYIDKANREKELFICLKCNFQTHADYNASLNILTAAVNQPNGKDFKASYVEAKACSGMN